MDEQLELNASVSNSQTLADLDLTDLDAVYLGQPYCLKYRGNFLRDPKAVALACERAHAADTKAYLTTPAIPAGHDWPLLTDNLRQAMTVGIDGFEVHDVGVFRWIRRELPDARVHIGNFGNVYNEDSAAVWHRLGATRIVPSHELTADELQLVTAASDGVEYERPVHGPLSLGMAFSCLLRRTDPSLPEQPCLQQCAEPHFLELDGWRMRSVGTSLLMGEDYCLVEHLADLADRGLTALRLETYFDSAEKINQLSRIYRRSLMAAKVEATDLETLRSLAPKGLCNGWHFGRDGRDYVAAGGSCVN